MHLTFILSALFTFLSGMGLLASVMLTRTSRATSHRLLAMTNPDALVETKASPSEQLKRRLFATATWMREKLGISYKGELLERFQAAGITRTASRDMYMAIRIAAPLAGIGLGMLFDERRALFMAIFAGAGYLGPDIVLKRMIKSRRQRIRLSIPDAIDLLVICVDAGLGMDQAMLRVSVELETSHPDLHLEFQTINREQRAGKPRLEAWQSMARRTAVEEIDAFVNMLMQTERFGTPIARALSNFADALRQKRRQRAEELAAKTTVKIMFPLVFFIFPTLFIVLIGPAAINIIRGMAGSH